MPTETRAVDPFELAALQVRREGRSRWQVMAIVVPKDGAPAPTVDWS